MKKVLLSLAMFLLVVMGGQVTYASDWDKFGKAMAVVEGVRVLSGGSVDVIGAVTGINRGHEAVVFRVEEREARHNGPRGHYEKVWVPRYVRVREYIPAHYEFRHGRRVYVSGYYVTKEVERGGYWKEVFVYGGDDRGRCQDRDSHH